METEPEAREPCSRRMPGRVMRTVHDCQTHSYALSA